MAANLQYRPDVNSTYYDGSKLLKEHVAKGLVVLNEDGSKNLSSTLVFSCRTLRLIFWNPIPGTNDLQVQFLHLLDLSLQHLVGPNARSPLSPAKGT